MTEQEQKAIKWMKNVRDDAVVTLGHIAKEEPNVSPMLYAGRKEKAETIIKGFEELEQYRAIGTVSELQDLVIGINALADSQFSAEDMAKLVNDMKSLHEYQQIGTPEECRAAVEKHKEMIAYCDENDCADCPYHRGNMKENRCMNDFIADEIVKGGGVNE